jgi:hypothetical protein
MIHVRLYLLRREQKKVENTAHPKPAVQVQHCNAARGSLFITKALLSMLLLFVDVDSR